MTTTTRFVGNCQICARDQKLHNERMVHHGYTRPGDGYIVGDCPGVEEVPYEVSCDLIKSYKATCEKRLAERKQYLADIKAGNVTYFFEYRNSSYRRPAEKLEYRVGVTEMYTWYQVVENKVWSVKQVIHQIEEDIKRCAKRIADWKPMPIRTVEEEQAKADAAKAERKAIVEAARAARAAKKAATRAKQEDLAARREVIKEGFRAEFRALALQPKSPERDVAVRLVCEKLHLKKHAWLWVYELAKSITGTLVQLDLAEEKADGRVSFKYPLVG